MVEVEIEGYCFQILPERALYWPAQKCLMIADLHLGKADTFRHFGIAVPQAVQWTDLQRLSRLLEQLKPQSCVVLGDFVHGRIVNTATVNAWNALVAAFSQTRFELLVGNHDKALPANTFSFYSVTPHLEMDGVWLSHEPLGRGALPSGLHLNIHGHIHPAMRVDGSRAKLPALVYRKPYLMMPAFSEFTAGVSAGLPNDAVWVFAQDASLVMRIR